MKSISQHPTFEAPQLFFCSTIINVAIDDGANKYSIGIVWLCVRGGWGSETEFNGLPTLLLIDANLRWITLPAPISKSATTG